MKIAITDWQHEMLKPFFDDVEKGFDAGNPCSIIAQIFNDMKNEHSGYLDVRLVPGDMMRRFQSITGVEVGKIAEGPVTVFAPCDDDLI